MVEVNTKLVSSHKEPALARSSFCTSLWAETQQFGKDEKPTG